MLYPCVDVPTHQYYQSIMSGDAIALPLSDILQTQLDCLSYIMIKCRVGHMTTVHQCISALPINSIRQCSGNVHWRFIDVSRWTFQWMGKVFVDFGTLNDGNYEKKWMKSGNVFRIAFIYGTKRSDHFGSPLKSPSTASMDFRWIFPNSNVRLRWAVTLQCPNETAELYI